MNIKGVTTCAVAAFIGLTAAAEVEVRSAEGWLESAWAEWNLLPEASAYNVYVSESGSSSWSRLDNELIRDYGTYGRADALGLKAGSYSLRIVPIIYGSEVESEAAVIDNLEVKAHDRTGYAHFGRDTHGLYEGVGAYKNDGTLKDDAIVLYVTADNAKSITVTWPYTETSFKTYTGFYSIVEGIESV